MPKKIYVVEGRTQGVIVANSYDEAVHIANRDVKYDEETKWNIWERNYPYGFGQHIPYGDPYFDDDPDLTLSQIFDRIEKENEERRKQEELRKKQLNLFEE